ncbi:MAG: SLC13 family permease, partial [Thermaerobacterales bacterium]
MPEAPELLPSMVWLLGLLFLTILLFVSDRLRVDAAAVFILALIGLTTIIPAVPQLLPAERLFDGFSSNAIIAIIAVMIIGSGLHKTGLTNWLALTILRLAGDSQQRIIPLIGGTVGIVGTFMQNIGVAALLLPVVDRIARGTGIPLSRLLLPMGFFAIMSGTLTMISSSPLILLNDLIESANRTLPQGVEPLALFRLFDVTPVGLILMIAAILAFTLAGPILLPGRQRTREVTDSMAYFSQTYDLEGRVFEVRVPPASPLAHQTLGQLGDRLSPRVSVVAISAVGELKVIPSAGSRVEPGATLAMMGPPEAIKEFAQLFGLEIQAQPTGLSKIFTSAYGDVAEILVPPWSAHVGKTLGDIDMRSAMGLNVLVVYRGDEVMRGNLRDVALHSGDILLVYSRWAHLNRVGRDSERNLLVLTSGLPEEDPRPDRLPHALGLVAAALALIIFTDVQLSLALWIGAIGMIVTGVLTIDEAYGAVSWRTVFLLASLIPLGMAMEFTGTAAWVAHQVLSIFQGLPLWLLLAAVAVVTTVFTLLMSNIGATVLLVPLAIQT